MNPSRTAGPASGGSWPCSSSTPTPSCPWIGWRRPCSPASHAGRHTTMRSYIARLRRVIVTNGHEGGPSVLTQSPGYVLQTPTEALDVARLPGPPGRCPPAGPGCRTCPEPLAEARRRPGALAGRGLRRVRRRGLGLTRGPAARRAPARRLRDPDGRRAGLRPGGRAHRAAGSPAGRAPDPGVVPGPAACSPSTAAGGTPTPSGPSRTIGGPGRGAGARPDALVAGAGATDPVPRPFTSLDQPAGQPLRGYRLGERLGTGRDGTCSPPASPVSIVSWRSASSTRRARRRPRVRAHVRGHGPPGGVASPSCDRRPTGLLARARGGVCGDAPPARWNAHRPPRRRGPHGHRGGDPRGRRRRGPRHGRSRRCRPRFRDGRQRALRRSGEPCLADFAGRARARACGGRCPRLRRHDPALRRRGLRRRRRPGPRSSRRTGARRWSIWSPSRSMPSAPAEAAASSRRRTRTRACGPSTRATPPTTSAGVTWSTRSSFGSAGTSSSGAWCSWWAARGRGSRVWCAPACCPRRAGEGVRSDTWFVTTMLPGASPFDALAESLRRVAVAGTAGLADVLAADGRIDRGPARSRPPGRAAAAGRRPVRGALHVRGSGPGSAAVPGRPGARHVGARQPPAGRGDATGRLLRPALVVQGFGPLVNDATVAIAAMTAAELEAAIVEPAERVGRRVERALVAELLRRRRRRAGGPTGPPIHPLRAGRARRRDPHPCGLPPSGSCRRRHRRKGRAAVPVPGQGGAGGRAPPV